MIFSALCLIGFLSLSRLPVELLPDIQLPGLTVITSFENAAPSEIEKLITVRIEEAVTSVSGVADVSSESIEGMSIVRVGFRWGTDMDMAMIETKEKVDLARGNLPEGTGKSVVVKYNPSDEPVMIFSVTVTGGDERGTRRFVEKQVVPFIERTDGVSLVDVMGGEKREIQVRLDNSGLYSHSLSLQEVAERIGNASYSYPAGSIISNDREYQVRTAGEFVNLMDIRSVVAGYSDKRIPVYLSDIAEVIDTCKERKSVIRFNGRDAVALLVRKEPGRNTISTCEKIAKVVEYLAHKNHGRMTITCIYDQSRFIHNSIDNVVLDAGLGGLISFFVLLFFLKSIAPPLIISTALPVSMLGTFILMDLSGISINSMSLGGLAIGTGITVDAGIVVLESIELLREEERYLTPLESAVKGTLSIAGPVVASVLSSVVVFIPIIFLEGLSGAVFRDLALAVSYSILVSLLSSLSLVPMLSTIRFNAGRFRFPAGGKFFCAVTGWHELSDRFSSAVFHLYEKSMHLALRRKKTVITAGVISLLSGILLFVFVDREVMPGVDPGEFSIEIVMPGGTPLGETSMFCRTIEERLMSSGCVRFVFTKAGCDPDDSVSERISGRGSDYAIIRVFMNSRSGISSRELIGELKNSIRTGENISVSYNLKEDIVGSFFSSAGGLLKIEVRGRDIDELKDAGNRVRRMLSGTGCFKKISSVLDRETPELIVDIDRARASTLGLTVENISSGIAMAVRGDVCARFRENDDEVDVRVRLSEQGRKDAASISGIMLKTDTGMPVPVSAFASIRESSGNVRIVRKEQSRINLVSAEIVPGCEHIVKKAWDMINSLSGDAGIVYRIDDGSRDVKDAFTSMIFATILAIVFIYMLLAAQFQSFRDPLIIMLSIPVTFLGISLSLIITGQSLNINSGIGIILLCGTVVNNGIVLFDFIENEKKPGMDIERVMIDAGKKRLNPILMNAFTTIFAVVPIALGVGEGTEIQKPMAVTVIGGTTVSTILTLIIIPVIYAALESRKTGDR